MNQDERLRNVFSSIFELDKSALIDLDSPSTIDDWDSVHHIQLIMAIEAEFDIQFDPDEIAELTSFGVIRERLEEG